MMPVDEPPAPGDLSDDHHDALAKELRFLAEWASGTLPLIAGIVRARQIFSANPWLAGR